jgi:Arc/MetJ-type ribon-helix-helix transcriptional regulator
MPTSVRKSRAISLRLSESEFEALKALHVSHGARSVSEFVRAAMQRLIAEKSAEGPSLELKVQEIDGKLTILDGEVARLTRLLESHHE